MKIYETPIDLLADAGSEVGVSEWLTITQNMVDAFANVTGDHQWIHVDRARAEKEMPDGKTIAHGYLTLSLVPRLADEIFQVARQARVLNYGGDKFRFLSAVQTGSDIRMRLSFPSVERKPDGAIRLTQRGTIEIRGSDRPALVIDYISLHYPESEK